MGCDLRFGLLFLIILEHIIKSSLPPPAAFDGQLCSLGC